MQENRGPRLEQQNHGPPRQQPNPQQEQQRKPSGGDSNGQHTDAGDPGSSSRQHISIQHWWHEISKVTTNEWPTVVLPSCTLSLCCVVLVFVNKIIARYVPHHQVNKSGLMWTCWLKPFSFRCWIYYRSAELQEARREDLHAEEQAVCGEPPCGNHGGGCGESLCQIWQTFWNIHQQGARLWLH